MWPPLATGRKPQKNNSCHNRTCTPTIRPTQGLRQEEHDGEIPVRSAGHRALALVVRAPRRFIPKGGCKGGEKGIAEGLRGPHRGCAVRATIDQLKPFHLYR